MEEKVFLIYKNNFEDDSKESIITTSDTEEEVKQFVNYLEEGNVDRDCSYDYEEVKFVKKLKQD